jgi:hypothetical protein
MKIRLIISSQIVFGERKVRASNPDQFTGYSDVFGVGLSLSTEVTAQIVKENSKAVPQHIYSGAGGRGGIAPTHSRSRH